MTMGGKERAMKQSESIDPSLSGEDYPELRESVRQLCANYPSEYWRELEKTESYQYYSAVEFEQVLTKFGCKIDMMDFLSPDIDAWRERVCILSGEDFPQKQILIIGHVGQSEPPE